ncbi:MAG: hypothetical protein CL943_01400 [Candidatus Diapherotrites archaeon]|uniref:Uncharacterized protein n=1 Tax=Candidatus Iainarchaeum sp. TaxID=3101447 RepID=A0A2D6M0K1_9ARCH|nr:hypothetical protein [Candidatus Diapherotrites archaeon]
MDKALAFVLTPVVFIGILIGAVVLSAALVIFLALNPLIVFGLVGIIAVLALAVIIFGFLMVVLFVGGMIYYALRDVNEPFQRSSSKNYSLNQQDEVGRKEQSI